jgi:hypothetical protein
VATWIIKTTPACNIQAEGIPATAGAGGGGSNIPRQNSSSSREGKRNAERGLTHGRKVLGLVREGNGGGSKSWNGWINPVPTAVIPAPIVVAAVMAAAFHTAWALGMVVKDNQPLLAITDKTFIVIISGKLGMSG